jgi:hypothetical protein
MIINELPDVTVLLPVGSADNVPKPVCTAEQLGYFTATFRRDLDSLPVHPLILIREK